jgi:hypothetical protein
LPTYAYLTSVSTPAFSAIRALTNLRTKANGIGFAT